MSQYPIMVWKNQKRYLGGLIVVDEMDVHIAKKLIFTIVCFVAAFVIGMQYERYSLYDLGGIVQDDGQSYPAIYAGLGGEGAGNRIFLAPSLLELIDFLEEDKTDTHAYSNSTYNCVNYSADLVQSMRQRGYYSCETFILFQNSTIGHAAVAVLAKEGVFYVEPQNDRIRQEINLGRDYWSQFDSLEAHRGNYTVKGVYSCFGWNEVR